MTRINLLLKKCHRILFFLFCFLILANGIHSPEQVNATSNQWSITKDANLLFVHFSGEKFFAGGGLGGSYVSTLNNSLGTALLLESTDGMNIQKSSVQNRIPVRMMTSDGNTILLAGDALEIEAYGFYHSSAMYMSEDNGQSWKEIPGLYGKTLERVQAFSGYNSIEYLEHFQNKYYALDYLGLLYTSSNGLEWNKTPINLGDSSGMRIGNNEIILWTGSSVPGATIYFGTEGKWQKSQLKDMSDIGSVFYIDGKYYCYAWYDCCYGEMSIDLILYESTDGKTWTELKKKADWSLMVSKIWRVNDRLVGITSGGQLVSGPSMTSLSIIEPQISGLSDIAYGNGIFVAVGNEGKWFTSRDGIKWSQVR